MPKKLEIKKKIGMFPGGRTMLFLYKRVHVFLRDGLLPDLKSKRWLRDEEEWVADSPSAVPQAAPTPGSTPAPVDNRPVKEAAEMFHYMMAVQDELKGSR